MPCDHRPPHPQGALLAAIEMCRNTPTGCSDLLQSGVAMAAIVIAKRDHSRHRQARPTKAPAHTAHGRSGRPTIACPACLACFQLSSRIEAKRSPLARPPHCFRMSFFACRFGFLSVRQVAACALFAELLRVLVDAEQKIASPAAHQHLSEWGEAMVETAVAAQALYHHDPEMQIVRPSRKAHSIPQPCVTVRHSAWP